MRIGEKVGHLSYVIYLIHLVPAGIINSNELKYIGGDFDFIKVPFAFVLIVLFVYIGELILKRVNNKLLPYFGYR